MNNNSNKLNSEVILNSAVLHLNLVWKFKCNICNDIYYVKTKWHFKVRVSKHLWEKGKTSKEEYNIWSYIPRIRNINFDDFKTLVKDSNEFRLLISDKYPLELFSKLSKIYLFIFSTISETLLIIKSLMLFDMFE